MCNPPPQNKVKSSVLGIKTSDKTSVYSENTTLIM